MNGDRIEGIWEELSAVTGNPETVSVISEESRLSRPPSAPPTWPAVSRLSATGYHQVAVSWGLRAGSIDESPPAPMKSTPVQRGGSADVAGVSTGVAAAGSAVQNAEAGNAGWMIPVTVTGTGPVFRRVPTRRPNRAAVAVVTAACTTPAEPPAGSRPATIRL
jgi:hypothetical protein